MNDSVNPSSKIPNLESLGPQKTPAPSPQVEPGIFSGSPRFEGCLPPIPEILNDKKAAQEVLSGKSIISPSAVFGVPRNRKGRFCP
jgi:hypothetical protein